MRMGPCGPPLYTNGMVTAENKNSHACIFFFIFFPWVYLYPWQAARSTHTPKNKINKQKSIGLLLGTKDTCNEESNFPQSSKCFTTSPFLFTELVSACLRAHLHINFVLMIINMSTQSISLGQDSRSRCLFLGPHINRTFRPKQGKR